MIERQLPDRGRRGPAGVGPRHRQAGNFAPWQRTTRNRGVPARDVPHSLSGGPTAGLLYRRSTAEAVSATRCTCGSSRNWPGAPLSVAMGVSVHAVVCFPVATAGSDAQRKEWLPDLIGGELLGAYCLSGRSPVLMRRDWPRPQCARATPSSSTGPRHGSPTGSGRLLQPVHCVARAPPGPAA